jgi:N-acetylglutamate synthase-like GNAT family acetyltransferase
MPEIEIEEIESLYRGELEHDMSTTIIALYDQVPVGSATLELNSSIRPDLGPWLGDLVIDPKYQKQGIGKILVEAAVLKAKELGFEKAYLFAFDPTIPEYYKRLGWKKIGMEEFNSHPVTVMEVEL